MDQLLIYVLCALGGLIIGAVLGRYYVPDIGPIRRAARQGKAYARALTFVLGGDRGQATTELAAVVEEDVQDIEPYFSLGCLFRERGEHERAVRLHQSVLLRHDVDAETQQRARYELGLDFLAAGFRRHAVRAFTELVEADGRHAAATRSLWRLHEEDGEYDRALEAYRRLCKIEKRPTDRSLEAHLLAEQGATEARQGKLEAARRHLREADGIDPGNVHVLAVWAQLERARGAVTEAASLWARALRGAPDLAPWIYPHVEEAFFEDGRMNELRDLLDDLLADHELVSLKLCRARLTAKRSPREATADLHGILAEAPALLPAREELGRLLLHYGTEAAVRAEYEGLLDTLKRLGRGYRCGSCGHAAADLFWRCPGCHAWGTVRLAWGRRSGEEAAGTEALAPASPAPALASSVREDAAFTAAAGFAIPPDGDLTPDEGPGIPPDEDLTPDEGPAVPPDATSTAADDGKAPTGGAPPSTGGDRR